MKGKFDNKVMVFATAIKDMYLPEDERESNAIARLELNSSEITEDFTSMIYAMYYFYLKITGDKDMDILGFTHMCNRLVFQHVQEK